MINRILIRIKVVQILYSYLLTLNDFKIALAPSDNSKESSYAFSLYQTLLLLVLELAGYNVEQHSQNPLNKIAESNMLANLKIAKFLMADTDVKNIINKGETSISELQPIVLRLYSLITKSSAYTDFRKIKRPTLADEVQMLTVILKTVIINNTELQQIARQQENFSLGGLKKAVDMVANTLNTYSLTQSSFTSAKKQLNDSLEKAYELYHALLLLPVSLTKMEAERLELAKTKYCPSPEELNPNTKFVDNLFVKALEENPDMIAYLKKHPISWDQDYFMLKELLDNIKKSQIYIDYMNAETHSFAEDAELWRNLLKTVVFPSDILAEVMEQSSVYWNDDLAIMGTFVLKTIKKFATTQNPDLELLPIYKDDEDAQFGPQLFLDVIKNHDYYNKLIDKFINGANWDSERLAFMDIIILYTAISELLNFPAIPIAVTMNEYVEIANYYSTPRSGQFINGILYSIATYLKEKGELNK